MKFILLALCALSLVSCDTVDKTVTVTSPDGIVTTTTTKSRKVNNKAIAAGSQLAGSVAGATLRNSK